MRDPVSPPAAPVVAASTLNSHFKMIFITVAMFTFAFVIGWVALAASFPTPSDSMKSVIAGVGLLGTTGFGTVVGLLGGKVIT